MEKTHFGAAFCNPNLSFNTWRSCQKVKARAEIKHNAPPSSYPHHTVTVQFFGFVSYCRNLFFSVFLQFNVDPNKIQKLELLM